MKNGKLFISLLLQLAFTVTINMNSWSETPSPIKVDVQIPQKYQTEHPLFEGALLGVTKALWEDLVQINSEFRNDIKKPIGTVSGEAVNPKNLNEGFIVELHQEILNAVLKRVSQLLTDAQSNPQPEVLLKQAIEWLRHIGRFHDPAGEYRALSEVIEAKAGIEGFPLTLPAEGTQPLLDSLIPDLQQILKEEMPSKVPLHHLLGEIYYLRKEYEDAIKEFKTAVEGGSKPSRVEIRYRSSLALAYLGKGDFGAAKGELQAIENRKQAKGDTFSAEDYSYLGGVYEQMGISYKQAGRQKDEIEKMHQEATNAFRHALKIEPNFLPAKAHLNTYITPTQITVTSSQVPIAYLWKEPKQIRFQASGENRYGIEIDRTDLHLTWTATGNVGSIDQNGTFTPVNPGKGEVRAISQASIENQKLAKVTVIGVKQIQIQPPSLQMNPGDVELIEITVYDTQDNTLQGITLKIEVIGDVAKLQGQQLEAVKPGSGLVKASFEGIISTAVIQVEGQESPNINIQIEPETLSFWIGDPPQEIEVKVFENGKLRPNSPQPQNTGDLLEIERINERKFKVSPKKPGRTTLVAREEGAIDTASVTIKEVRRVRIQAEPPLQSMDYNPKTIKAEVYDSEGELIREVQPEIETIGSIVELKRKGDVWEVIPRKPGIDAIIARVEDEIGITRVVVKPKEPPFLLPLTLFLPISGIGGLVRSPQIRENADNEKEKAQNIWPTAEEDARIARIHWGRHQKLQTRATMINFTSANLFVDSLPFLLDQFNVKAPSKKVVLGYYGVKSAIYAGAAAYYWWGSDQTKDSLRKAQIALSNREYPEAQRQWGNTLKSKEKTNWFVANAVITGAIGIASYFWYDEPEERAIKKQIFLKAEEDDIIFGIRKNF
jgi:tetratricopeptide (TPR) repeat protein